MRHRVFLIWVNRRYLSESKNLLLNTKFKTLYTKLQKDIDVTDLINYKLIY